MTALMTADVALRSLLSANPDAIVSAIGRGGGLVAVPDAVLLHGHHTIEAQFALDLIDPDDQLSVIDAWATAQREPIVRVEVHLLADPERTATVHIFDVRSEYAVHMIVVEGQNLDAVVRASEARAARRRGVAHVRRDALATFIEVDEATTSLLGWTADELLGRSTIDLVHPDDVQSAIDSWMEMRSGRRSRLRVRLRHADDRFVWVEVTNENRLADPAYACVVSELVDISAEMAQLEAVHERERQLARLAEALPIGICHLRPGRDIVYTNAPLVDLLGPIDTVDDLLRCIASADRIALESALDRAFEGFAGHQEVTIVHGERERRCEFTLRTMTDDEGKIDGVIICAADVTDRSRLRAELEHKANHDDLTGCLNRAATAAAVDAFLLESRPVAVAFIDLDDFKSINDEIGHAAGDELLRVAATRLRNVTRDGDLIGRIGGDEFVVVCTGGDTAPDPAELASRLSDALNGDAAFGSHRVVLRASVGAAISYAGEVSAEGVLQRADAAMYVAKRTARAEYATV